MRSPLGAQLTRSTESACLPKEATWGAEAGQGRGVDASMHGGMQCRATAQAGGRRESRCGWCKEGTCCQRAGWACSSNCRHTATVLSSEALATSLEV
jgi:hypothetical protein